MSQTRFVEYRQRGFWAYDVALAVFLKHLIEVAEERSASQGERWLTDATQWWRVVACDGDYGLVFGEDWSRERVSMFLALAREACARIARRDRFTAAELGEWSILDGAGVFARGESEVAAGPVLELGQAIIDLLRGALPAAPAGAVWCFGAPGGRRALALESGSG